MKQTMKKHIVMTGATSGFGIEWIRKVDKEVQADFFVLARSKNKFDELIQQSTFQNTLHFIPCDLSSFQSIKDAVTLISKSINHIDVLINNAGVWSHDSRPTSKEGIELTFAVNHLAPFLLTQKLLPLLNNAAAPRVINTASFRHTDAVLSRQDMQLKNAFTAEKAYCNSKLFTILFTKTLAKKAPNIHVSCFDPGIVDTHMLYEALPKKMLWLYPIIRRFIARTPQKGAQTGIQLTLSTHAQTESGGYYKDNKFGQLSQKAQDNSLAIWLWDESEKLIQFHSSN